MTDEPKKCTDEWAFKKTRSELIAMVQRRLDSDKFEIPTAEDIVDCICIHAWDYLRPAQKAELKAKFKTLISHCKICDCMWKNGNSCNTCWELYCIHKEAEAI